LKFLIDSIEAASAYISLFVVSRNFPDTSRYNAKCIRFSQGLIYKTKQSMTFFNFEQDFVTSLRCIPMVVRFKLDTCGVKLKLMHWHQMTQAERASLVELPCEPNEPSVDAYKRHVQQLVCHYTGAPASELVLEAHPAWLVLAAVPEQVQAQAQHHVAQVSVVQWAELSALQRFALIKLSRPGHENHNFWPAMQEFGLAV
jgi:hypothetical protein